jgi:exonuclease SbcD
MRVAITADVHLRSRVEHPERYNALENIFEQIEGEGAGTLVIAGDLFDKDFCSYVEFERLCRAHASVQVHIIPGNHDPMISARNIVGDNVHVYSEPTAVEFGATVLLFVPYEPQTTMGQRVVEMQERIAERTWILIGHGTYCRGSRLANPLEPGTYMPLSGACVDRYRPRAVLLGHIHKPLEVDSVYYPGSPCGMDVSETGRRRFLVYNTSDGSILSEAVDTDVLYFRESFVVVPAEDETVLLERQISERIASWGMQPSEIPKIILRASALGYALDREGILNTLKEGFRTLKFHANEGPDIERLRWSNDLQRMAMAKRAVTLINEMNWPFGGDQPTREQVVLEALGVIYGL